MKRLPNTLLYHVVRIVELGCATTTVGRNVSVKLDSMGAADGEVKVINTEIFARNGVTGVIDSVISPRQALELCI